MLSTSRLSFSFSLNNTYRRVPTVIPPPQLPRLLFINVTVMPAQRTVPKSMQNVLVTHLGTVMLWAFIGVIFALIAPEI
ncbi:hypothetical protein CPB85DRAFT_157903 [Mucidula mucida]|nr:hypothetical protein CPB85DRAFT_157903 [Mucidula mucida]